MLRVKYELIVVLTVPMRKNVDNGLVCPPRLQDYPKQQQKHQNEEEEKKATTKTTTTTTKHKREREIDNTYTLTRHHT